MADAEQQFSIEEISRVLDGIEPERREQLLAALGNIAAEHEETSEQLRRDNVLKDLAVTYRRTDGSDSNIEGWTEDMYDAALEHLHILKGAEARPIDVAARSAAACMIFIMDSQRQRGVQDSLFNDSGVDMDWFSEHLRQGFIAGNKIPDSKLEEWMPELDTIERMARYGAGWGNAWGNIVDPLAQQLIADLEASGVVLPVLGDDGLYDEEREDWDDDDL